MSVEKTDAIVLHTYNLQESSKIVVLLTPVRGKVRAVAKGVRRTKSKFGSALEPVTHIEAQIHYKEGRDLQTLSQAETRESFQPIRSDLTRLGLASMMCELMEQFVQEDEESSREFVLLLLSLRTLATIVKNYESLLIAFYMKLLDISGLLPEVNCCVRCKGGLQGNTYLDAGAGGALCARCSAGMGEKVSAGGLKMMQRLHSADWVMLERIRLPKASADEVLGALNGYVLHHTGREVRSGKFLRALSGSA
ncbi:MAG: DNA repair protein RecO [Candidatus Abyssobacteria bacterium SURF_17]|uniref:DNA repair protein RecO n=1 Tax=Candidatus Abyssobacteria bacterium SURF_17 TaxID=2093361 RepID=A0A419F6E7_9BACT|nr:MAG: DNA repair protein RecO [Candidatus Abyssubacteria bacterium SURF_17]